MSEFKLANKIFDALFDEDDLKEMRQRGFIAQEKGFKLSAIATIQLELEPQWISVDDEIKPFDMQTVLLGDENDVSEGYFSCEGDESYFSATGEHSWKFKRKNPTHWMPLPPPPKV